MRGLLSAAENEDPFCRFATAGLTMLFGLQSCINMAVNVHLMPAKGMTLPFISYGGSSLISLALGMGFLLAVTRRRPRTRVLTELAQAETAAPDDAMAGAPAMSDAPRSSRRRRHRRPSLPGAGAGACAGGARRSVELVTDERALRYGGTFPARAMHTMRAATPRGGSPLAKAARFSRSASGPCRR